MTEKLENQTCSDVRLDNQLCFALYSASNTVGRYYQLLLKPKKLTYSQYLVLMALIEEDGISISSLAERLEISKATMTPMLRRLETKGLLNRAIREGNEREKIVSLTRAGRRLWDECAGISAEVFDRTGLTASESGRIIRSCAKIVRSELRNDT